MALRQVLVAVATLAFAVALSIAIDGRQALETRTSFVEPPRPASSLAEMWHKTTIVVVGSVREVGPAVVGKSGVVHRTCTIAVEELLKVPASSPVGPVISVSQPGGTARVGTIEYRTGYLSEPLVEGVRAILFLEKSVLEGREALVVNIAGGDALRSFDGQTIRVDSPLSGFAELKDRSAVTVAEVASFLRSQR